VRFAFALAALGLGLFKLADKGLWLDEAVALRFALSPPATWIEDNNMALFYALLSLVVKSFGDGEAALRILSVLAFAASAPVFHALLTRAFDAKSAHLGCALFVANAYLVHFAQEARGYMLAVLLTISASYALLRLSDPLSPRERETEARALANLWPVVYAATIGLALYAHAFALWVLLAHGLCGLSYVIRRRAALRSFAIAFALAGICALPLVRAALRAGTEQISWISPPTLESTLGLFTLFAGGSRLLAALLGALFVGFLALTFRSGALSRSEPSAFARLVLASWFLVPVFSTLVLSRLFKPIVHPKYLLVCLPALLAGAAVYLAQLAPRVRALVSAALLLACASGLYDYYAHYERERWRELVAYLAQEMGPRDRLVLDLSAPEAFDYYVLHAGRGGRPALPRPLLPDRPWSILWPEVREHDAQEESARFAAVDRLWLVQNRSDDRDLRARLTRTHSPVTRLAFEPKDGDDRSLFASSQGRIIWLESFVRSAAGAE
jgi:4-amino-4-deoxy-L-arabinose transferase-like glycosyltransferase